MCFLFLQGTTRSNQAWFESIQSLLQNKGYTSVQVNDSNLPSINFLKPLGKYADYSALVPQHLV